MKKVLCFAAVFLIVFTACTKDEKATLPKSKTDYLQINYASTATKINAGEPIVSIVNCGYFNHWADIRFLKFEVKKNTANNYDIKATAFYDNINYYTALDVVSTFDTTLTLPTSNTGLYILKFYSFNQFIEADTVTVE